MTFLSRLSAGAIALALLSGCFGSGDGSGCDLTPAPNGLAGNGTFTYVCTGAADPQCDGGGAFAPSSIPTAIARGGRFGLRFDGSNGVTPVSTRAVETPGNDFIALAAGRIGFVVLSDTEVVDAIRLNVLEPDNIAISGRVRRDDGHDGQLADWEQWSGLARAQHVRVGSVFIRAVALVGATALAGTISDGTWTVDPPDLATVVEMNSGTVELTTHRRGAFRLSLARGGRFADVRIEVDDSNVPVDAGEDADASDASDGGSEDQDASEVGGDQ